MKKLLNILFLLLTVGATAQDRIDWDQIKAAFAANYIPLSDGSGNGVWTTRGAVLSGANSVYGTGSTGYIAEWLNDSTLTFDATGAYLLSVGTDAQRPTGATGLIRYNSTNGNFEYYGAAAWEYPVKSSTASGLFTAGSILFADANGRAGENNAEWYIDNTNRRMGIGTATVDATLDVKYKDIAASTEKILEVRPAGAVNDVFGIFNGTTATGRLAAIFYGYRADATAASLLFRAFTITGEDSGTAPIGVFAAMRTSAATDPTSGTNSSVVTRPLYEFRNNTTDVLTLAADGKIGFGDPSPDYALDFGISTNAIAVPDGTVAQRPTAEDYLFRGNTDSVAFEGRYNAAWNILADRAWARSTFAPAGATLYTGDGTLSGPRYVEIPDGGHMEFYTTANTIIQNLSDASATIRAASTYIASNAGNYTAEMNLGLRKDETAGTSNNIYFTIANTTKESGITAYMDSLVLLGGTKTSLNTYVVDGRFSIGDNTPEYAVDLTVKTDGVALPVGTTAQRPTNAAGVLRWNSDDLVLEVGDGSAWDQLTAGADGNGIYDGDGSLGANTTVTSAGYYIDFNGTTVAPLRATATDGAAFNATNASSSYATAVFSNIHTTTNATIAVLQMQAQSTGTPAAGFGAAFDAYLENDAGANPNAARYRVSWEDATSGSTDSKLEISLQVANALTERFELLSSGQFTLSGYGDGTHTGTATRVAEFDTNGKLLDGKLFTQGSESATPDGSGDITVTHNLPDASHIATVTGTGTTPYVFFVHTKGATTFLVRVFDMAGAAVTAGTVTFDWIARDN